MDGLDACPHCRQPGPVEYGTRTSGHPRGTYGGWTTTTARYGCRACGAVSTLTVRVPPPGGAPVGQS